MKKTKPSKTLAQYIHTAFFETNPDVPPNAYKKVDFLENSYNEGITRIDGLEIFTGLKLLPLHRNHIKKIEGLDTLENLEELQLQDNLIREIANISHLKKLKVLNLSDNLLTQMNKELNGLVSLEVLELRSNRIREIIALPRLRKLRVLNLSRNKITRMVYLSCFVNLQTVDLSENPIELMEDVNELYQLKSLNLGKTRLENEDENVRIFEKLVSRKVVVTVPNRFEEWSSKRRELTNVEYLRERIKELENENEELSREVGSQEDYRSLRKEYKKLKKEKEGMEKEISNLGTLTRKNEKQKYEIEVLELRSKFFDRVDEDSVKRSRKMCDGKIFSDYITLSRLGVSLTNTFTRFYGSNSLAYLCCLKNSNEVFAMKIGMNLNKDTNALKTAVRNEIIDIPYHPNVISHLSYFVDEIDLSILPDLPQDVKENLRAKTSVIIFKYYPKNLKELIRERKNKFKVVEFLMIAEQILKGLCHLYEHKICHRDIKPDNLFITDRGSVVIGDFGEALNCSQFGGFQGTINLFAAQTFYRGGAMYYLSPEILGFKSGKIDYSKNDVFALGLVLYSMMSKREPFDSDVTNRKQSNFIPLKHDNEDVSKFVNNLLIVDKIKRSSCEQALKECQRLIHCYI